MATLPQSYQTFFIFHILLITFLKLTALIVTLVVLLILAGITIAMLFGEHGAINKAQTSNEKYKISQAREKLELGLNTDAAIEKRTNPKYNQDDFLDELILSKVSDTKILDDIVITDGYAFKLDRSVPKLGEYIGKESDLVFPTLQVTTNVADDYKTATITINAEENKNGISKIEIIQGGFVIKEYTYDNKTGEITENFEVKQNGTYIVKVYSKLSVKDKTEVNGLVSSIEYSPNGDEIYKKEHKVKVTVKDKGERVKNIKYQWLQTTAEPAENTFTESCNDGDTITKNEITGTWYLWTLLETESGKSNIGRSEAFNFDNEKPNIVSFTAEKYSETGITLSATAQDTKTGIIKFEFYIDGVIKDDYTQIIPATTSIVTKTVNITGISTGTHTCMVKVYDKEQNDNAKNMNAETKKFAWERWNCEQQKKCAIVSNGTKSGTASIQEAGGNAWCYDSVAPYVENGLPRVRLIGGHQVNVETNRSAIVGKYMTSENIWYKKNEDATTRVNYQAFKVKTISINHTYSDGTHSFSTLCDWYKAEWDKNAPWNKSGSNYISIVTSFNSNAYTSGQRNADGYWYATTYPR